MHDAGLVEHQPERRVDDVELAQDRVDDAVGAQEQRPAERLHHGVDEPRADIGEKQQRLRARGAARDEERSLISARIIRSRATSAERSSAIRFPGLRYQHRVDESFREAQILVGLVDLAQIRRDGHALHARHPHVCITDFQGKPRVAASVRGKPSPDIRETCRQSTVWSWCCPAIGEPEHRYRTVCWIVGALRGNAAERWLARDWRRTSRPPDSQRWPRL